MKKTKYKLGIVMDPISAIDPKKDSSLAMLEPLETKSSSASEPRHGAPGDPGSGDRARIHGVTRATTNHHQTLGPPMVGAGPADLAAGFAAGSDGDREFTLVATPSSQGEVLLSKPAGGVTDGAGNAAAASSTREDVGSMSSSSHEFAARVVHQPAPRA